MVSLLCHGSNMDLVKEAGWKSVKEWLKYGCGEQ